MSNPPSIRPVYMPWWLRIVAIVVGLAIATPPLAHMIAHISMMVQGLPIAETGSDWARFAQIALGVGVGFPDPVIGMIRAWRGRRDDTSEREARR